MRENRREEFPWHEDLRAGLVVNLPNRICFVSKHRTQGKAASIATPSAAKRMQSDIQPRNDLFYVDADVDVGEPGLVRRPHTLEATATGILMRSWLHLLVPTAIAS